VTTLGDVQNAIKVGIASLGAVARGAVVWADEQRPTAKTLAILNLVDSGPRDVQRRHRPRQSRLGALDALLHPRASPL
jgi:hypothetical protein